LGEIAEQDNGIVLVGLDGFDDFLVGGKAAKAGLDAAVGDVFLDLGEELMGDFAGWSVIGFECGRWHIFQTIEPTLAKNKIAKGRPPRFKGY
jgi:hypothetical protein